MFETFSVGGSVTTEGLDIDVCYGIRRMEDVCFLQKKLNYILDMS